MNYLHYRMDAGPGALIQVKIEGKAHVRLLDLLNYYKYRVGKPYISAFVYQDTSLVQLSPPYRGEWHIIVDLDGKQGEIKAIVDVVRSG